MNITFPTSARWRVVQRRLSTVSPRVWAGLVTLCALVLYLLTRSAALDDFDSYSFALALDRFDITLQQPQPPGFPVYVAAGRLFDVFAPDARRALTALSAVSGALAVGAVYVLGWQLFRRRTVALLAAAIFALSPIQWLASGKALSDVPGLAMALLALVALWAARTTSGAWTARWLVIGAGILGLSLGVRAQTNLPGLVLALWLTWETLRVPPDERRARWRALFLAAVVGAAAILIWLVPVAQASGGLSNYLDSVNAHSDHVWESDSLFGQGTVTATMLRARVKDTLETFLVPTLGISVYEPFTATETLQLVILALWLGIGLVGADYRRVENHWLVLWFLLIFVPYFLLESLNRPRLLLPALPPLILLVVGGWARWAERLPRGGLAGQWMVGGGIALALLLEGAPLAATLATEQAPPSQAAEYLQATYPAEETLLAVAGSFRTAQVELPDYRWLYLYAFDAEAAAAAVASGEYRFVALLDREQFSADVIEVLSAQGRYVPVDDRLFVRDPRVHWQHAQVRLQVLMPADQIDATQLQLPPDGRIELGAPEDGRFVGEGWFRAESIGGAAARWAGDSSVSAIRVSLAPDTAYTVTFQAAAYPSDQRLTVRANGRELVQFDLPADWGTYTFTLPDDVIGEEPITTLEFEHAHTESPYARTDGGSSDRRELAAAYAWIAFSLAE